MGKIKTTAELALDAGTTLDIDSAGALQVNSSAGTIGIGNDAIAQNINIGTGAAARTITMGNVTGATGVAINAGTGSIALASTGAGDITLDSDDTLLLDADGVLELNSTAGVIGIGNDADAQNINIGTGAAARTITVGNATGATAVTVDVGTGTLSLGTTATAHTTTVGSVNTTSDTTVQSGSGALNVTSTNGALTVNSGTGALGISTDASATTVSLATGGAVKTVSLGSTNGASDTLIQSGSAGISLATSTNGPIDMTSGTGAIDIGVDAAAKTITMGNVTGATGVAINSGTGSIALASTGTGDITLDSDDTLLLDADGVLELNSSAGAISLGNDADAQNINIGTGAAARTITMGNVTGATAVNINTGTGDFTLASASGTLVSQLDTGEMTKPLQPAFLAYNSATDTDVTGAGTSYVPICDTEVFDQGSDYNTGTGEFTASVTGKYFFSHCIRMIDMTAAMTNSQSNIITSNRTFYFRENSSNSLATGGLITFNQATITDMDAADIAYPSVLVSAGAGDTADVVGHATIPLTCFSGYLVC